MPKQTGEKHNLVSKAVHYAISQVYSICSDEILPFAKYLFVVDVLACTSVLWEALQQGSFQGPFQGP